MKAKLTVVALSLMGIMTANAIMPYDANATKQALKDEGEKATKDITSLIRENSQAHSALIKSNTALIVEAIRTGVSQKVLATEAVIQTDLDSKKALAETYNADKIAGEIVKTELKFGSETGQGYNACKVFEESNQIVNAVENVKYDTVLKQQALDNSAGRMVANASDGQKIRQDIHHATFCTNAEAAAGKCSPAPDELQGADSNAGVLFASSEKGSALDNAKTMVRQNIIGSPIPRLPKAVGQSAEGQAYLLEINQKTALSAFPAYSLAYLHSMSEINPDLKGVDGNPTSPNELILNTVARYYGGKDAEEWQKSLINQVPRGILVESAKIEGFGAWLDYQELLRSHRMEGNFSALLVSAVMPMQKDLDIYENELNSTVR